MKREQNVTRKSSVSNATADTFRVTFRLQNKLYFPHCRKSYKKNRSKKIKISFIFSVSYTHYLIFTLVEKPDLKNVADVLTMEFEAAETLIEDDMAKK